MSRYPWLDVMLVSYISYMLFSYITAAGGHKTTLVGVPRFASTGCCVLINLRSLLVQPLCFSASLSDPCVSPSSEAEKWWRNGDGAVCMKSHKQGRQCGESDWCHTSISSQLRHRVGHAHSLPNTSLIVTESPRLINYGLGRLSNKWTYRKICYFIFETVTIKDYIQLLW